MTLEELKDSDFVVGMKETERAIEREKPLRYLSLQTVMNGSLLRSFLRVRRQTFPPFRNSPRRRSAARVASK